MSAVAAGLRSVALRVAPARLMELLTARRLLVLGLFALALGIRLYNIDTAPGDFHPARQYRSFIIARGFFFDAAPWIPEWQRQVAAASRDSQGLLEPPIMELLTAAGHWLLGGEQLWLPRLLSSVFWLAGGAFLYSVIRRIVDGDAALLGTAFYLLLPFGIAASRSFQPDPLMVAGILAAVWATIRHDEHPSPRRLLVAGGLSSFAFLVQPRAVFVVGAVFVMLAFHRDGVRRVLRSRDVAIFAVTFLVPPLLVYGYGVISGMFRTDIAQGILLPQLWISPFLWRGWVLQIEATVGLIAFVGALLGTLLFREGRPRAVVIGLWAGYLAFGLAFDFAVAVHDYYHLQLVPIVAISAAPIAGLVMAHLSDVRSDRLSRIAVSAIVAAAVLFSVAYGRARIANPDWESWVAVKEEIGAAVDHSTRTVFLSGDYGTPLEYHGLLAGSPWPLASDLEWERLAGVPPLDAARRFEAHFADEQPEYFIVEDLAEFEQQGDLVEFLAAFPVLREDEHSIIYDLRAESAS